MPPPLRPQPLLCPKWYCTVHCEHFENKVRELLVIIASVTPPNIVPHLAASVVVFSRPGNHAPLVNDMITMSWNCHTCVLSYLPSNRYNSSFSPGVMLETGCVVRWILCSFPLVPNMVAKGGIWSYVISRMGTWMHWLANEIIFIFCDVVGRAPLPPQYCTVHISAIWILEIKKT